ALTEAIPDEALRARAVCKVLTRRGTSLDAVLGEIDAGLRALEKKLDSWDQKVGARRAEHLQELATLDSELLRLRESTDRETAELKARIAAKELELANAAQHCEERKNEIARTGLELDTRNKGFQQAHATVRDEYLALTHKL